METTNNSDFNSQIRVYFKNQSKHLLNLENLLKSNAVKHHLKSWLSLIFEILLYILFGLILIAIFCIPTSLDYYIPVNETNGLNLDYSNSSLSFVLFTLKVLLLLAVTPLILFAILLGRNRRKNKLIREAYIEVTHMKEEHDKALFGLKF